MKQSVAIAPASTYLASPPLFSNPVMPAFGRLDEGAVYLLMSGAFHIFFRCKGPLGAEILPVSQAPLPFNTIARTYVGLVRAIKN